MGATTRTSRDQLLLTLMASSAVSLGFLLVRILATQTWTYWFLAWNLALAWLPLAFAWWLLARLGKTRWHHWTNLLLTVLWLAFLPNAFYIASDMIHLRATGDISLLYDVTMFISFMFNGFILGYVSLYGIHARLRQTLGRNVAHFLAGLVLLLCSFAIYLGRYLRWNSWDIILNPFGLIFDVSEPFVNPSSHPQVFTTTLMFFALLTSIYAVGYQLVRLARQNSHEARR
ncbi:MAG: hypothetical protein QG553_141 [Patescibacteria group bacterium]|nr:hypothetical protein [Patescibacteria group bacterium]